MSESDLLDRALALHDELRSLRLRAKGLPLDHIDRWRYSLRVHAITEELALLQEEYQSKLRGVANAN